MLGDKSCVTKNGTLQSAFYFVNEDCGELWHWFCTTNPTTRVASTHKDDCTLYYKPDDKGSKAEWPVCVDSLDALNFFVPASFDILGGQNKRRDLLGPSSVLPHVVNVWAGDGIPDLIIRVHPTPPTPMQITVVSEVLP